LAGPTNKIRGNRRYIVAKGEIKRLERSRGFGFIRPEGASEDIFFHSSALQGLVFDQLNEGQTVEFEKQADDRDPRRSRAANVRSAS
jgi:CspA family cold shock protein